MYKGTNVLGDDQWYCCDSEISDPIMITDEHGTRFEIDSPEGRMVLRRWDMIRKVSVMTYTTHMIYALMHRDKLVTYYCLPMWHEKSITIDGRNYQVVSSERRHIDDETRRRLTDLQPKAKSHLNVAYYYQVALIA